MSLPSITARGYDCKYSSCVVQLGSAATRGGARVAGVRLRVIDGSAGED